MNAIYFLALSLPLMRLFGKKKKETRWAPNSTRACNVYGACNGLKKRVARVGKDCPMLYNVVYDAEIGADIIAS